MDINADELLSQGAAWLSWAVSSVSELHEQLVLGGQSVGNGTTTTTTTSNFSDDHRLNEPYALWADCSGPVCRTLQHLGRLMLLPEGWMHGVANLYATAMHGLCSIDDTVSAAVPPQLHDWHQRITSSRHVTAYSKHYKQWLYSPEWIPVKDTLFVVVVHTALLWLLVKLVRLLRPRWRDSAWAALKRRAFSALRLLPGVQARIDAELAKAAADIQTQLTQGTEKFDKNSKLPSVGLDAGKLRSELAKYEQLNKVDWAGGKVSGTVYHGGSELGTVLVEAYAKFLYSNPLHPDVFPAIRLMESEVVAMTLNLFSGSSAPSACGSITSGGTESIMMACKAYRDMARDLRGVVAPEMIVPVTAHAAFDKAAAYFNIKLVHVPMDRATWQADAARMRSAITKNTVMLVASAPNFPHGIIDDVEAIGRLAQKHSIPLHVDCCLGSFVVPYLSRCHGVRAVNVPRFDFSVAGVTSISCDTHKYGYAPKGSSVVMYRDRKYRAYQYSVIPDWTGGIYASPSMAGSRPGALIAGCWAAMMSMGDSGYASAAQKLVKAAQTVRRGIEKIEELQVCGEPMVTVVAFTTTAKSLNIFAVADAMTSRGWNLNTLQNPPALHLCCTLPTVPVVDKFLVDLRVAVAEVKANPAMYKDGAGAIYGMAASIPDKSLVGEVAKSYMDALTHL